MNIEKEVSLKEYNTFSVDVQTDWIITYDNLSDLKTIISDEYFQECRFLHIGEGSNLLFLANFNGVVLHSQVKTIEFVTNNDKFVELLVGSGYNWDEFVSYACQNGYYGAEALSLIPGQVGSSSIQNIGAYGVEVEQLIQAVHTIHRRTGEERVFTHEECHYAYRYSIFKEAEFQDYIITKVHFRLTKSKDIKLNYTDLKNYFAQQNLELTPENLRQTVIQIRTQKLPDPKELPNAGSFFMNPIVDQALADQLLKEYPNAPHYSLSNGKVKLAAGWLIEQCGLKGYKLGNVGTYERQALVLVNYGDATGRDIANLAIHIQEQVKNKFGVEIYPEVRYI